MSRVPRLGPYRIAGTFATSPDGRVFRAYNTNTDVEVLMITAEGADGSARLQQKLDDQQVGNTTGPLELHLAHEPAWLVLPREATEQAARLIGLAQAPRQNWFAANWGWPYYYPKTVRQLGFRCACTIAGMAVLFWIFTGLGDLARLLG